MVKMQSKITGAAFYYSLLQYAGVKNIEKCYHTMESKLNLGQKNFAIFILILSSLIKYQNNHA